MSCPLRDALSLADLDSDGEIEMIVGCQDGHLAVFKSSVSGFNQSDEHILYPYLKVRRRKKGGKYEGEPSEFISLPLRRLLILVPCAIFFVMMSPFIFLPPLLFILLDILLPSPLLLLFLLQNLFLPLLCLLQIQRPLLPVFQIQTLLLSPLPLPPFLHPSRHKKKNRKEGGKGGRVI